jgi:hypothetical protein
VATVCITGVRLRAGAGIFLGEISGSHDGKYEDYLSSGKLRRVVW